MNAPTCQSCHHLLASDATYCPDCGAPVPQGPATFVLEDASGAPNKNLFVKPKRQTTLSWGPILVGLVALFAIVVLVVTLSGTGSDIASAPIPTPEPSPTPSPQPRATPTEVSPPVNEAETAAMAEDPDNLFDDAVASSGDSGGYLDTLPDDLLRVEAGSDTDDYTSALLSLAETYDLRGIVVFATAETAIRVDLETGNVIQIPLDDRRYLLGGRTGIISADPGRTVVAHRWDAVNDPIEVAGGYYDVLGTSWVDPNGWELVAYSSSGRNSVMAPWETTVPDSPNLPSTAEANDLAFNGPVDMVSAHPRRWTWDDGWIPLPWDAVLLANDDHLLVRKCFDPGECTHLIVDDQNVLFQVDGSIPTHELSFGALSPQALMMRTTIDDLVDNDAPISIDDTVRLEIVDLETGTSTLLPEARKSSIAGLYWLDSLLVLVTQLPDGESHLILDRNGEPVAELRWAYDSSVKDGLHHFAPSTSPMGANR